METTFTQYCRIEKLAGGCGAGNKAFIKACHKLLSKQGKSRDRREFRHNWIRSVLQIKKVYCLENIGY